VAQDGLGAFGAVGLLEEFVALVEDCEQAVGQVDDVLLGELEDAADGTNCDVEAALVVVFLVVVDGQPADVEARCEVVYY
jgi:hypothetical protein